MKKLFTLVLLALVGTGAFAQKTTVTGVVLDSLTRVGEPAAIGVSDPTISPLYMDFDAKLAKYFAGKPALLWIGCGNTDFLYQANLDFMKKLDANKFPYTFMETDGGHIWKNWRIYLTEFVPLLFK